MTENISDIRKKWFIEQVEKLKADGALYAEIASKLGVAAQFLNGILHGSRPASEKMVAKLCKTYNIDQNSLFNRMKGYNEPITASIVAESTHCDSNKKNLIPFYDDVISKGGMSNGIADVQTPYVPMEFIDAGDWFPEATAAISHYGDSMVEYSSGSILALKRVNDHRLLIWGRNYLIETTEFRVTKQLQDGGVDYVVGYSSNKDTYPDGKQIHSPIYIPKDSIRYIDQVIGCVTKEYSNGSIPVR